MSEKSIQIAEVRMTNKRAPWFPVSVGNYLVRIINRFLTMEVVGDKGQRIGTIAASGQRCILQLETNPVAAEDLLSPDTKNALKVDANGKITLDPTDLVSTDAGNTLSVAPGDDKLFAS